MTDSTPIGPADRGRLRFLAVCLPYAGHVNPTLGTVAALVAAGHDVSYVLDPRWRHEVEATGAGFIPYDDYPDAPGPLTRTLLAARRAFATARRVGSDGYDCVLYEGLLSSGKALADSLGLPAVRLSSTFAYTRRILDEIASTGGAHFTSVMRAGPLYRALSASARRKGRLQTSDFITEIVDNPPDLTYVYTSRSFQLDAGAFGEERFRFIGPSLDARRHEPALGLDLDSLGSPLIYISMGTLLNKRRRLYRSCIAAFADAPVTVLMSVGRRIEPASLGPLPGNVVAHPWVPQLEVLDRADLFITHGGMNSVNESIHAGVPMLVIPQGNDQPTVAARVESLGLGLRLDPGQASPDRLRSAGEHILASPTIAANLAALSADMRAAGGNARAVDEIVRMVGRSARPARHG